MDRAELEGLDRESLVRRAEASGIKRARILTRPELVDELLRLDEGADPEQLRKKRGFFGRARDLVARVVERGLHLPDAADRIRNLGTLPPSVPRAEPQAVPTVTLAEIYAAQGHRQRAVETLRRVLEREPEHGAAQALLAQLEDASYVAPAPPLPPEGDFEPMEAAADASDEASDAAVTTPGAGSRGRDASVAPEVVAIPLGGGTTYVAWREAPREGLVLRVVIVTPTWDGPLRETRDIDLDDAAGELVLRGLPARAVVRVAVGKRAEDRFAPLAHSPALEAGASEGLVKWTLRGPEPVVLDDPRAASIARAARAAARHA
jgi:hypothetical protein